MSVRRSAKGAWPVSGGGDWAERLLHGVPALLAYLDAEQRVMFANHAHQAWLGAVPDALIGRLVAEVVGKRAYRVALPALQRAYAGHAASCEGMLLRMREPRYMHGNFEPDVDGDGRVRGVFVALLDITRRHTLERQLHESEQRFYAAFQHATIGMALTGPDGRFLRVNAALCRMLGYTEAELLALDSNAVSHPDDLAVDLELLQQVLRGERDAYQIEKRNLHKDGHVVHLQLSVSLVRDAHGAPLYLVSQAQDISQRKAFEDALHRERELAQVTLRSIGDAVLTTDVQLRVTSLNPIAEAMTGWSAAGAMGRPIEEVFPVRDARTDVALGNPLRAAIISNSIVDLVGHSILRHRSGFDTPVEDSSAPIHDHAGNVIGGVLVFHDISETRSLALKMIHLTQHDVLTGLPNRSQVQARIQRVLDTAARRQQRGAVLYLDLDNFTRVNEQYGHAAGDRVLRALVVQLRSGLTGNELLSRYGGDEFVVVLPQLQSTGEALGICQQLMALCAQTVVPGVPELALRMCIGVSLFPADANDPESLLQHAEAALRAAKMQGQHVCRVFSTAMTERSTELRRIETGLRSAVRRRELVLYYQPKVRAHDQRIVGAEALMRWVVDGEQPWVPDQFIPVAEDSGQILAIGNWALRVACQQARRWQRQGRRLSLSVNVSPLQFQHPGFYGQLTRALEETGADPQLLELEVTERMVMSGGEATTGLLGRIKRTGVRLSLDDFGTGYCSLSYLRHFPIDVLKIDRVFVHELTVDADTDAITRAIIVMARSLNKDVIAEGVETVAQADFLRDAGCSQLQGFRYGQALPVAEFDARFDAEPPLPLNAEWSAAG
jgi:diguanylate cyclase (GGDEF)-like protein/PAS domain S-box-containing protein